MSAPKNAAELGQIMRFGEVLEPLKEHSADWMSFEEYEEQKDILDDEWCFYAVKEEEKCWKSSSSLWCRSLSTEEAASRGFTHVVYFSK